jgi:hypothetical protein
VLQATGRSDSAAVKAVVGAALPKVSQKTMWQARDDAGVVVTKRADGRADWELLEVSPVAPPAGTRPMRVADDA